MRLDCRESAYDGISLGRVAARVRTTGPGLVAVGTVGRFRSSAPALETAERRRSRMFER